MLNAVISPRSDQRAALGWAHQFSVGFDVGRRGTLGAGGPFNSPKECLFGPTSFLFEEAQHSGTLGNELPFPLFEIHLDPARGFKDASPSLHA